MIENLSVKHIRAVIAGVEGTVLGLSVLTLSNEGGALYPPHYYMPPPPRFSDLATALLICVKLLLVFQKY